MNIEKQNKLIIISSPSGAGKTTLCKLLLKKMKNISLSISYTSRSKRLNEVEGKDYWCEEAQEWTTTHVSGSKPYPSWIVKDIEVGDDKVLVSEWAAPIDYPNDGNSYIWDEESVNWI